MIEAYINPSSLTLSPLELICIRAFHANLADLIVTASEFGPNQEPVLKIINVSRLYIFIEKSHRMMNGGRTFIKWLARTKRRTDLIRVWIRDPYLPGQNEILVLRLNLDNFYLEPLALDLKISWKMMKNSLPQHI